MTMFQIFFYIELYVPMRIYLYYVTTDVIGHICSKPLQQPVAVFIPTFANTASNVHIHH
jgi:hypothetical protein